MADNSFHGMRIGSKSLEREDGVKWAERIETIYDCPNSHIIVIPFSVDADIPRTWICSCGSEAVLRHKDEIGVDSLTKNVRSHWDIVQERRTKAELKVELKKRLELLRQGKLRVGV
jgi:hypothetical protein